MTKKNKQESNIENSWHMLLMLALGIVALWFMKHESSLTQWYFFHYEQIYLGLWGLFLALVGAGIYFICKKTKKIKERAILLENFLLPSSSKIFVGTTKDQINLHLSDKDRCSHVQVIGTTGRGKTQSIIIPWALHDLNRKKSSIIIDGKGSRDVPEQIKDLIQTHGLSVRVDEFDLEIKDSVALNPLRHGTAQQITDRIFASFDFEDPFYRAIQYDTCGYLVRLILELRLIVTFKLLYQLLTDDTALTEKLKLLPAGSLQKHLLEFLRTPIETRRKNLAGLISQLSPFATGELARLVNGSTSDDWSHEVSIANVLSQESHLLMISIPTLKYQKIGYQLGKLILQDLAFAVGERENQKVKEFASVFLDEFSEFAYEGFVSILNKARSAKVALHLSHQSMGDLSKVSVHFANAVTTNTNIKCILGLNDPETADFFARHLGTDTTEKYTEQVEDSGYFYGRHSTGRSSKREVESYKVHPNILKELTQGRGVLHLPTPKGNVTEVIKFNSLLNY